MKAKRRTYSDRMDAAPVGYVKILKIGLVLHVAIDLGKLNPAGDTLVQLLVRQPRAS